MGYQGPAFTLNPVNYADLTNFPGNRNVFETNNVGVFGARSTGLKLLVAGDYSVKFNAVLYQNIESNPSTTFSIFLMLSGSPAKIVAGATFTMNPGQVVTYFDSNPIFNVAANSTLYLVISNGSASGPTVGIQCFAWKIAAKLK